MAWLSSLNCLLRETPVYLQPEPLAKPDGRTAAGAAPGCQARSAGTEPGARVRVTAGHLGWADVVLNGASPRCYSAAEVQRGAAGKRVINLRIPNKYPFMDASLQQVLRNKFQEHPPQL